MTDAQAEEIAPRATQLRQARERRGLSLEVVAGAVGISRMALWDLEAYDEEMHYAVSLATARRLATLLGTSLAHLFIVDENTEAGARVTFEAFPDALRQHLLRSGETPAAFGDRAGWGIEPVLTDRETVWGWCPDQLRDVCRALDVNWASALPQADPPGGVAAYPHGV